MSTELETEIPTPSSPEPFDPGDRIHELESYLEDEMYARWKPDIEEVLRLYKDRVLPITNTRHAEYPLEEPPSIHQKLAQIGHPAVWEGRLVRIPGIRYYLALIFFPLIFLFMILHVCSVFSVLWKPWVVKLLEFICSFAFTNELWDWWRNTVFEYAWLSGFLYRWVAYLGMDRDDGVHISETW
ncbi:hypothetical protein BDV19DRAFT_384158 [Aspergillus venezuelensis]